MPGIPDSRSPIRVNLGAKANLDQLMRKHAARLRMNFTRSRVLEAATMVAEMHPDEMDAALVVVVSAESGRTHDGTQG